MAKPMIEYTWRDLTVGNVVDEPGNSTEYKTGDWKSQQPVFDESKCIRCAVCWNFCPDMAIYRKKDGFFTANLDYCKGCGICAQECPTGCISMQEEVE